LIFSLLPSPKADKIGVGGGIGGAMEGGSESNAANVLGGFPIPSGSYPLFERYPKYVVDFQLQERSRLENEERSIKKKRENLHELQRQSKDLQEKDLLWRNQQEEYIRSENERLVDEKRREQQLVAERIALNKLTEERRLRQSKDKKEKERKEDICFVFFCFFLFFFCFCFCFFFYFLFVQQIIQLTFILYLFFFSCFFLLFMFFFFFFIFFYCFFYL
jgi:cation transport ATPase